MNTPTIEEVKKVAKEYRAIIFANGEDIVYSINFSPEELQAFAQNFMNKQRESDAKLCKQLAEDFLIASRASNEFIRIACLNKNSALSYAESAIRNNTGE